MSLIKQGLAVQKQIVEANNNVVPFPTPELAKKLHAEGKVIVHKPNKFKAHECVHSDDDLPPEAA